MDRLYDIRRVSREMASYSTGSCHLCKLCSVKVRRLTCGKHNCCRMCVEFVPRLIKGDFTCKTCSTRRVFDVPKRKDDVDVDVLFASKWRQCDADTTFATEENEIVSFDESPEDNDLDGYNTEWDYLLESYNEKAKAADRTEEQTSWISNSENLNPPPPKAALGLIPRKRSYVKLAPPSTMISANFSSTAENQSSRKSNTIIIADPAMDRACRRSEDGTKPAPVNKFISRGIFQPDPNELERGTSPCKGHRRNVSFSSSDSDAADLRDYIDPSVSDTEQLREQIGDIEGPAFTSSSASGSDESLIFSPSNLSTSIEEFEEFWDRK